MTETATDWSRIAIDRLRDVGVCPRCEAADWDATACRACGADYSGHAGYELRRASFAAALALEARQRLLEAVPSRAPLETPQPVAAEPVAAESAATPQRSSATVQSVLAVAGAGLVAVAAMVFAYSMTELALIRSAILLVVMIAMSLTTIALARRGLRFSSEAVGALAIVLVALVTVSVAAPTDAASPWFTAAVITAIGGILFAALGRAFRIRAWSFIALCTLPFVPVMLGAASSELIAHISGLLAGAAAALATISYTRKVRGTDERALRPERVTLTIVQIGMLVVLVPVALGAPPLGIATVLAIVAALALLSARNPAGTFWSGVSGFTAVATPIFAVLSAQSMMGAWLLFTAIPVAAVAGLLLLTTRIPSVTGLRERAFRGGALAVICAVAVPLVAMAVGSIAAALTARSEYNYGAQLEWSFAPLIGTAIVAAGLLAQPILARRSDGRLVTGIGAALTIVTALSFISTLEVPLPLRLWTGLALATGAGLIALRAPMPARRWLSIGGHAALVLCAVLTWHEGDLTIAVGVGVVLVTALLAFTLPPTLRFVHVAAGYAYALALLAHALTPTGLSALQLVCVITGIAAVTATAATFIRVVTARAWYALLAVTAVPFVAGVALVVFERSAWTAVSTAMIFALAATLTSTRRRGLPRLLRAGIAALLVPSLAVVAVCLGAQVLASSGSPVVLPAIAVLVAAVLPSLRRIRSMLAARIGFADADAATRAIEASTLITAAITVALALTRAAAGLHTALLVLLVIAVGAFAAAAIGAAPRYGWWLGAASVTGALWCGLGIVGAGAPEAYVVPPAIAAAIVGAVRTARGAKGRVLFTAGLGVAVGTTLVTLIGSGTNSAWRTVALLACAAVLVVISHTALLATTARTAALRVPALLIAIVAASAGTAQAVRWGLGLDAHPAGLYLALVLGCASALPAIVAARALRGSVSVRLARWLGVPAVLYLAAASWPSMRSDWDSIWTMWMLMLAFLVLMQVTAGRGTNSRTTLPPVWVLFVIAFITAVVAWSPRELRVEWFSIPLGFFLLATGATGLTGGTHRALGRATWAGLDRWPNAGGGSWVLLAPGLFVLLSASMAATYTDPLTWRAILVIAIALAAIVVGASRRLAAPFIVGIVVLPIENALAVLVQIGRGIEAMPWWITLSVVGAVLLTIAVTYERGAGINARLRDLG